MTDPIKVTVSDPSTGEALESRILDNDFIVLCAGDRYIDGVQAYANGTQVLTVKRRPASPLEGQDMNQTTERGER